MSGWSSFSRKWNLLSTITILYLHMNICICRYILWRIGACVILHTIMLHAKGQVLCTHIKCLSILQENEWYAIVCPLRRIIIVVIQNSNANTIGKIPSRLANTRYIQFSIIQNSEIHRTTHSWCRQHKGIIQSISKKILNPLTNPSLHMSSKC